MQPVLYCESIGDAIAEAIRSAGGAKSVAGCLWPALPLAQAHSKILDCLNADRPAKLSPDEVMAIAKLARGAGCDAIVKFMALEIGYAPPVVMAPASQAAVLLAAIERQVAPLGALMAQVNALKLMTEGKK